MRKTGYERMGVDESGSSRRPSVAQGMINRLAEGEMKERGYESMGVEESLGSRKLSVAYG